LNDFKGADTLLFVCDLEGVRQIVEICKELAHKSPGVSRVDFASIKDTRIAPFQRIFVVTADSASSHVRVDRTASNIASEWWLGRTEAFRCEDRLNGLVESNSSAHVYLEEEGHVMIMVSIREYPADIINAAEQPNRR
jgi:hypothetical protein